MHYIHPSTHLVLSWVTGVCGAYLSSFWVKGRGTPWTGHQSILHDMFMDMFMDFNNILQQALHCIYIFFHLSSKCMQYLTFSKINCFVCFAFPLCPHACFCHLDLYLTCFCFCFCSGLPALAVSLIFLKRTFVITPTFFLSCKFFPYSSPFVNTKKTKTKRKQKEKNNTLTMAKFN